MASAAAVDSKSADTKVAPAATSSGAAPASAIIATKSVTPASVALTPAQRESVKKWAPFGLTEASDIDALLDVLKAENYKAGEYCFVDGDLSDRCWIIADGEWTLELAGQKVAHFTPG